jgi:hypothetical protein
MTVGGRPRRLRSSTARPRVCTHLYQAISTLLLAFSESDPTALCVARLSYLHCIRGGTSSAFATTRRGSCTLQFSVFHLRLVACLVPRVLRTYPFLFGHRALDSEAWSTSELCRRRIVEPPSLEDLRSFAGSSRSPNAGGGGGSPGVKDDKGDDGRRHVTTGLHSQHCRRNQVETHGAGS